MLRVLVVDDDANVRFTVRVALEGSPPPAGEPMEVLEAEDGLSALLKVTEDTFDLVLLDVMMPGMDGFGVLRSLRDDDLDLPVIMLTAKGREADITKAYRAGADGYITKPFDVDELATIVREIAESTPMERALRRAAELQRAELLLQLEHNFDTGP